MQRPSLSELRAAAERARDRDRARPHEIKAIDRGRPLVPEHFTQLYHTPWYRRLDPTQRLRYNQLYGLRSNEVFMLFEQGFTCRVVERLRARCLELERRELAACLELMLYEEGRHHTMFREYNRRYLPDAYRHSAALFVSAKALEGRWLRLMTDFQFLWPALMWLILVLEEFSTAFSRMLLHARPDGELGPLDASYVEIHRLHLLDEARHVHLDSYLIEDLLDSAGRGRVRVGAWLFRKLFGELMVPKRSGAQVLRQLVLEHPELTPQLRPMLAEVRAQGRDQGVAVLLEDPQAMPVSRAMLARYPGFHWSADLA